MYIKTTWRLYLPSLKAGQMERAHSPTQRAVPSEAPRASRPTRAPRRRSGWMSVKGGQKKTLYNLSLRAPGNCEPSLLIDVLSLESHSQLPIPPLLQTKDGEVLYPNLTNDRIGKWKEWNAAQVLF